MADRLKLHAKLIELLGSNHVYYQSPETIKMEYPAIRYSKTNIKSTFANSKVYSNKKSYEIIVIDKKPDNVVIDKMFELPYVRYDRHYVADNLNHDVFTIYY